MYIKKIRRICDVKGCKNMDSFFISRIPESGGSVIMCADCVKEAAEAIENYKEPEKKSNDGKVTEPPRFIFSRTDAERGIAVKTEEKAEAETTSETVTETPKKADKKTSKAKKKGGK